MKTILIPVFDGMVGRNLFETDILRFLKEAGMRIVIIPPKGKADYYESRFSDREKVVIAHESAWLHSKSEFILAALFRHSIPTHAMKVRQVYWYWNEGKYLNYFVTALLRNLGYFRPWHYLIRFIDARVPIAQNLVDIFNKYQPDMVFAPTMVAQDEVSLMRLARRAGKKTVGMVKSWDNYSTKAFLRFFPDMIIAHNDMIRDEGWKLFGYPKEQTVVTGIPQYDLYADKSIIVPREAFLEKIGADPAKKLILYAPAGDWMSIYDKEVLAALLDWIDDGKLGPAQVLLRLHPAYESKTAELKGRKNLIIERPGTFVGTERKDSDLKKMEFDVEAIKHLANSLYHADVTINSASTMCIEAAVFDRPIVLVSYDGKHHVSYWRSIARNYERDFYVPLVESGGAALVNSEDEFFEAMKRYLAHPEADHPGRVRMVEEQCYKIDGKSSERVANALLKFLN